MDVLKEPISESMRAVARTVLQELLSKLSEPRIEGLPEFEQTVAKIAVAEQLEQAAEKLKKLRELKKLSKQQEKLKKELEELEPLQKLKQIKNLAVELEEKLYQQTQEPNEYLEKIATLGVFFDPNGAVGQFARFLRNKTYQGVYSADRLLDLSIVEMLPEVFQNSKANLKDLVALEKSIRDYINYKKELLRQTFNARLYKTTIPTQPIQRAFLKPLNSVPLSELCSNPYWETKEVNTIICKEAGSFYCLDSEQLLIQIAETESAVNPYTKTPLRAEIIANLKKRYPKEIAAIKDGQEIVLGKRTVDELSDISKTLEQLEKVHEILNKDSVLEAIEIFGLESLEDPDIGGVVGILKVFPQTVIAEFEKTSTAAPVDGEDEPIQKAINELNTWLEDSIANIKEILTEAKPTELAVEEEDIAEQELEKLPGPIVKLKEEEQAVKDQILIEDSLSKLIYTDYLDRLLIARDAILEDLKKEKTKEGRQVLTDKLRETQNELKSLEKAAKSFAGIIDLLQQNLSSNKKTIKEYDTAKKEYENAVAMGLIFPIPENVPQILKDISGTARKELGEYILNLLTEIDIVKEKREEFLKS